MKSQVTATWMQRLSELELAGIMQPHEFTTVNSAANRGGSRCGQSGHATHVKNAQVINIQS